MPGRKDSTTTSARAHRRRASRRSPESLRSSGDRALVAVEPQVVRRALVRPRRSPRARVVAGVRALDLHDVGAEVAERHRAERAGEHAREVGDEQAVAGRARPRSPRTVPSDPPCARSSSPTCTSARRAGVDVLRRARRCSRRSWSALDGRRPPRPARRRARAAPRPRARGAAPPRGPVLEAVGAALPRGAEVVLVGRQPRPPPGRARGSSGAATTAPPPLASSRARARRRHAAGRGAGRGAGRPRHGPPRLPGHVAAPTTSGRPTATTSTATSRSRRSSASPPARWRASSRSPAAAARRPTTTSAALAPLYALLDALAERAPDGRGAGRTRARRPAWRALDGRRPRAAAPGGAGGRRSRSASARLNLAGLGPVRADLSGTELRRAGLRAMGARRRRAAASSAGHVIFGHTHRAGPLAEDDAGEWRAGAAGGLSTRAAGSATRAWTPATRRSPVPAGRRRVARRRGPAAPRAPAGRLGGAAPRAARRCARAGRRSPGAKQVARHVDPGARPRGRASRV